MADPSTQSQNPPALAIIPARFASTRFPGKPLACDTGKPLIQHVVQQVQKARCISRIIVATDDQRIFDAVKSFGGEVIMTRQDHPNGTSRIAEVVEHIDPPQDQIIVNVQGDEPEIPPEVIDKLVQGLSRDPSADMATLYADFGEDEDPANPHIVKVIKDHRDRAIYFSRSLIPHHATLNPQASPLKPLHHKHPGLYAYRRDFLLKYPTLKPTPLEQAEKLEQLRVIEHGYKIALIYADAPHPGIDTPEQYAEFVKRHCNRSG